MTVNAANNNYLKRLTIRCEYEDELITLDYSRTDKLWEIRLFDWSDHELKQRLRITKHNFEDAFEVIEQLTRCDEGVTITPEVLSDDAIHRVDRFDDDSVLADSQSHEEEEHR